MIWCADMGYLVDRREMMILTMVKIVKRLFLSTSWCIIVMFFFVLGGSSSANVTK